MTMSSRAFTAPRKQSARKGEKLSFSSSDDLSLIKQVESTHAPDDRDFNLKPLLDIVEDIFHRATLSIPGLDLIEPLQQQQEVDALEGTALGYDMDELLEILSRTIYRISCELTYKCSGGGDANSSAMTILSLLSNYKWDAKLVMALAGFAVVYGEFGLDVQLHSSNDLAKSITLLKQLPSFPQQTDTLKPKLEAVTNLIQGALHVSKCIAQFKDLPPQYISQDTQELVSAISYIPAAVYWSIRAAVACASQIVGLIGSGAEHIATEESWELLSLAHKLSSIHEHLTRQLTACHKLIAYRKFIEAYETLVRLFKGTHTDNLKILIALFPGDEPLYHGITNKKSSLSVLRKKVVLLLISNLDISDEELVIFHQMYTEAHQNSDSLYEVVWLPIVADQPTQWTEEMQQRFRTLRDKMPWYSVDPTTLDPAVVKYAKEDWEFKKRPILVVLNQVGKVVNDNAIHMMWIWASASYPFTIAHEQALWKGTRWNVELLAYPLEQSIRNWIKEDKFICLYGGEDMEWIRRITYAVHEVANAANVPFETLYVGKSNPREKIRKNIRTIQAEGLSHTLHEPIDVWVFWTRIQSMLQSKTKLKKLAETENGTILEDAIPQDTILQEIMTLLTFDGSDEGWAMVSFRNTEMAKGKGETIQRGLTEYSEWMHFVKDKGFMVAFNDYLRLIQSKHHCNRLILSGSEGGIPGTVCCAECGKIMEQFIMYRCCDE